MIDPFFSYLAANRKTISNELYGNDSEEKWYSRVPYEALPPVVSPERSFTEVLLQRRSERSFANSPMKLEEVSALLRFSLAKDEESKGDKKYPFPSGGGFYPIETYLYLDNVAGKEAGIYHYSTRRHSIALLKPLRLPLPEVNEIFGCAFESMPHMLTLMTMVKSRTIHKYGAFSSILCLIEAGHRGQNMCLSAAAHDLGACPMGGGDYAFVNDMLGVDGSNEHWIYGIAAGVPSLRA